MLEQLSFLVELQKLETENNRINIQKKELPNLITGLEKAFQEFTFRMEEENRKLDELHTEHRNNEEKLKRGNEGLKKAKERLLEVKTNKEYQAALKEIDDIKQHNSDIETEILLFMEKTDTLAKKVNQEEGEYQKWFQEFEKTKETLNAELEKSNQELQNQQALRNTILENIEPDLIKKFEMIKERRQGLAVVSIQDGLCTGCNINIPPQKILEIRKSNHAIMQCPFCNRIVYFEESTSANNS